MCDRSVRLSGKLSNSSGSVLPGETSTNWAHLAEPQPQSDAGRGQSHADSVGNILHVFVGLFLNESKAEACCFIPHSQRDGAI